jgi:hypothetical protein
MPRGLPRDVSLTLIEGDMRGFAVPEQVPLVIAPARAFLHNLTEADRLACLRCVVRHLRPCGVFAFNVFHPSLRYMAQHSGPFAGHVALDREVSGSVGPDCDLLRGHSLRHRPAAGAFAAALRRV